MKKILLCDDSNMILTILEKRLRDHGYTITGKAKDGDECLRFFQEQKPDLILLDITMPNKDGRECLQELMVLDPSAKVIIISAILDPALQKDCLSRGAKAFISKGHLSTPEDFNANILQVIQSVLDQNTKS